MTDLERLLCKVNKVTAYHRHGQKIPENALDDLANTQVKIEEHTQQYNSEAIKTIRKALISYRKYLEIQEFSPTEEAQDAFAALDSLAANSKDLNPAIQTLVQENVWELARKPVVEPSDSKQDFAMTVMVHQDMWLNEERIRREYERLNRNLVSAIKEALDKIRIGDEIKSDWSYVHDAVTRLKTALKWNDSDTLVLKGEKK
jgi:hypothetical protein